MNPPELTFIQMKYKNVPVAKSGDWQMIPELGCTVRGQSSADGTLVGITLRMMHSERTWAENEIYDFYIANFKTIRSAVTVN